MPKQVFKDPLSEATKEALRLFFLGLLSFVVSSALDYSVQFFANYKISGSTEQIVFGLILAGLRSVDKYWHERQKETKEVNTISGLSNLLQFKNIQL